MSRSYGPGDKGLIVKRKEPRKTDRTAEDFVRRAIAEANDEKDKHGFDYRSASLKMHGTICARCGKEFAGKDLKMLTVHHKDFNHDNNPRDGSNWENLCIYCHEDVHARHKVQEAIMGAKESPIKKEEPAPSITLSLADKLKEAMEKKKKK